MKYDRDMSMWEFIRLTGEMGYWFPWRFCGSPFFRERIFNFFESGATPQEIIDWCYRRCYDCAFHAKKADKTIVASTVPPRLFLITRRLD